MAMQTLKDTYLSYSRSGIVNGNYDHSRTNDAERSQKAKEAGGETEKKDTGKLNEPQDEYISSEKSGKEPTGLYRIGQDENGRRKIFFDAPNKAGHANGKEKMKASKDKEEKPEICVGNSDAVEREIRELKEKKQELQQQLRSASGNKTSSEYRSMPFGKEEDRKIRELEKELAQVEQELSQKDNDTYRRQHTVFSQLK